MTPPTLSFARPFALFLSALVCGACFSPEELPAREDEADAGEDESADTDACIEFEEPCESNVDCCGYDPEFPVGSSQCVAVSASGPAECAAVCLSNDDCSTDCCAALEGVSDYGACVETAFCEGG